MKILYFKLENSAGLSIGSNKNVIEIDFKKSKNKIISIQGLNGSGKSCLLSALVPFSGVTASIDERGSIPFITKGKDGYKEIHYELNKSIYIIKHFYKASKDGSHSCKSYFSKDGEELNKNGNVSSFCDLVEIHFGLTPDMIRLIRIGSNVNSFVNLQPSKRKEYIGKLINEIDTYIQIYKKINDDLKLARSLLATNNNNILKCNITNIDDEVKLVQSLKDKLSTNEQNKEEIYGEISKQNLIKEQNNSVDLINKININQNIINDFNKIELLYNNLDKNLDFNKLNTELSNELIELQAELKSNRLVIDSNIQKINQLKLKKSKISNSENLNQIKEIIENLKSKTKKIKPFLSDLTSSDIYNCINLLENLNQIGKMIYSFDTKSINKFIELKLKNRSISKFLEIQAKQNILFNKSNFNSLLKHLFNSNSILEPNCDNEFKQCPFYKLSEFINPSIDDDLLDTDTLKQIGIIDQNFNNIENQLLNFKDLSFPDKIKDIFKRKTILFNMENRLNLFNTDDLNEYLFIIKENENQLMESKRLKEYEQKLKFYQDNGIEQFESTIEELIKSNDVLINKNNSLINKINKLINRINDLDKDIKIINQYQTQSKIIESIKLNLNELNLKLEELNSINDKINSLEQKYFALNNEIINLKSKIKIKESNIDNYKRLIKENTLLELKFKELSMIHESVSTKKGIPVIYIKSYLERIHSFTNKLLEIIYEDSIQISNFVITQDSFEIPYVKNGLKIPDIKFGSQSEVALITMAISFALIKMSTKQYNILLLDEIDAGLDDHNKSLFLEMLNAQMSQINSEQVFIISHNLANGVLNIPMDVIKLTNTDFNSKLFNVIYE